MLLRSIRSQLLALVLATVVPFTALIGGGLWSQWRNDKDAVTERAIGQARVLAAQVDDHIGDLDSLLAGLSEAVSVDPRNADANDAILARAKAGQPEFVTRLTLSTLDGSNIGSSGGAALRKSSAANRSYFPSILAGQPLAIGDVTRGSPSGVWIVNVARPVLDRDGHLRGVIAAGTWLEHFQDALRMGELSPGSILTIINQKGIVLARSVDGAKWIGRDVGNWSHTAEHVAADEGSDLTSWSHSDGIARVTAFASTHRAPWRVIIGVPMDTAFASVARRLGWSALFILGTLVVGFAIAWVLSGRVVRPLRHLGKDASRLASGELSHRSSVRSKDELGTLADDFNRMATALERRAQEACSAADEMRRTKDTLAAVIDASPVAIVCCDLERRTVLWNRAAQEMFGYTAEEALGEPSRLIPVEGYEESQELFERAVNGETYRHVELIRRRKDGSLIQVRVAAAPMYNLDGTVRGVARAYEDITESKRAEEQLRRLAHYDPLTGLPNRLSLHKELGRLLSGCQTSPVAIALFDLDGFKDVNDTLGHSTGDQLLIAVCERFMALIDEIGEAAKVCRLGGDEFVVIMPECGDPRVVGDVVTLILRRLAEPYDINGNVLHLGSSAGIAIAPNDATHADELIANADLALYQAKAEGGQTCRYFLPMMRAKAQARRGLGIELRRAFTQNEFELYYQPQIRLADRAVVGAEALLRWRHPERGLIAPAAFIEPLAESAIAPEVGRWILTTACMQASDWRGAGLPLRRIAVNLFPVQAHDLSIVKDVEAALRASGLPPDALELEITENVALNHEECNTPLQEVQELGVKLAFDDFGTGYASLSYLTRFPVWRIKVDRSFVSRMTESPEDGAVVRSLIAMAHNLGLHVIAEGVETDAQAGFLLAEHCEEAQGYLYAKPLPAAEFEQFLRAQPIADEGTPEHSSARARNGARQAQGSLSRRKLRRM